jgi:hypothetical protein
LGGASSARLSRDERARKRHESGASGEELEDVDVEHEVDMPPSRPEMAGQYGGEKI